MSDSTIGRGVIELSADGSKLNAAINEARKSIRSLGDDAGKVSKAQSASIDKYVRGLQTAAAVQGRSTRETELYKLALRGASDEQLRAANSALRLSDAYQRGEAIGARVRIGLLAIAGAAAAAGAASIALFNASSKSIDGFNDLKDATGASIENISALDDLARRTGASFETVETSLIKFNAALKNAKPDSDAARAFEALNLNVQELKNLDPAEAFRRTAIALSGFADDANKARLLQELFGKSLKEIAPLLKDLAEKGELVAVATTKQGEAAEVYRKNIYALEANVGNLARSLTNDLIPALNNAFTKAQQFSSIGDFFSSFGQQFKANIASDKLRTVTADIESLQKTIDRQGGDAYLTKKMAGLRAEASALSKEATQASENLKRLSGGVPAGSTDDPNKAESARLARVPKPSVNIRDAVKKTGGGGGGGKSVDREAEQIRRAELDADLKFLRDKLGEERDTISFHQRQLSVLYADGNISLRQFYDDRAKTTAEGVQRELNLLADEQARLEVELERVADPSDRIKLQTQLDESIARSGKVSVAASREATLAKMDEVAAFKQLQDAVDDYRANLLQLQGDEAGAARMRAAQTIDRARTLSRQSGGKISEADVQAQARALESQIAVNSAKEKTSQINQRLSLEEGRISLLQRNGSIGEIEALQRTGAARQKVYGELARQVEELQAQADENPLNVQLQIDASAARLELEKLGEQLDPLKAKFDDLFRDSAGGAINDFLNGTKSAKEALRGFGKSILSEINAMASKEVANQLFGKGGPLGSAGGLLAGLFGGKKGGSAADIAAAGGVNGGIMGGQSFSGEKSIADLFKTADAASQSVDKLAMAADSSGKALTGLPGIIQSLLGSVSASGGGGGGSGGGWGSLIGSVIGAFSGGGGSSFSSFDTSGYNATGDIGGTQFSQTGEMIRARRALGGPVSANGAYRVNDGREREPELLTIAGKDYLMMGSKPGKVSTTSGDSGAPTNNTFNVTVPATTPRETANQIATRAARKLDRAKRVR